MKIISKKEEQPESIITIELRKEGIEVSCSGPIKVSECLNAWEALTHSITFSDKINPPHNILLVMAKRLTELSESLPSLKEESQVIN